MSSRNRGYTVVEVLMALSIFAVGLAGVVGMQRVSIQGGVDARNFDVGTNLAREWMSRLERDAYINWTTPDSTTTASNRDLNTTWLKNAVIGAGWRVPAAITPYTGNATTFDVLGRDLQSPVDPSRVFCAQYRLAWVAPDTSLVSPTTTTAILRAEVRVFWSRLEFGPADCSNIAIEALPAADRVHIIYMASAIRGNPLQ